MSIKYLNNKVRYFSTTTKSLYTNSTESTEPANFVQQLGQSSQFLKELASRLTEAGGKITIELEPGKGDKLTIHLEFIEWLRGLVDGEGFFGIVKGSGNSFRFMFRIALHVDDKSVLEYIRTTLGFGNLYASRNCTIFNISSEQDILIILAIFAKYNLNSSKHLNFLAFVEVYKLYPQSGTPSHRAAIKPILDEVIKNMNSNRVCLDMPDNHQLVITPN